MARIFTLALLCFTCFLQTSASISITDTITPSCNNSGIVKLGATGGTAPYRFKLKYGVYQNSSVFTGLGYGSFTFFVEDATSNLDSVTLTVGNIFNVTATYNSAQQKITATPSGGAAPYQYFWPGFYNNTFGDSAYIRNEIFAPLFAGRYLVQVKDNNGCVAADSLNGPTSPQMLSLCIYIKPGSSCYTQQDDSIVLVASGGAGGYT